MEQKPILPQTKFELAQRYGIPAHVLKNLMNDTYFKELEEVGYVKMSKMLTPKIIRKFIELHDKPLTDEDFN
jgi:hypothetical protein